MPKELEDIILKAIEKDPEKRFQSAHELRRALLKVGMTHVRAYRRLKTLRKEKDKAALTVPQSHRRTDEIEDGSSFLETLQDRFEQLRENRKLLAAAAAGLAAVGIGAAVLLLRPTAPEAGLPPVAAIEAPAPVAATPAAAELSPSTAAAPAAVAPTHSEPAPATVAQSEPPVAAKPLARKPVTKTRATKKPDKYDTLKKAWGG